jgi:NADPH-dependent 2,4-dienoyl-CoA reductase/sulfur reductase-like enzyme
VASTFASLHVQHGVDLRTGVQVTGIERDGDHAVVQLGDGAALPADLIVVGVGVAPNTELAETAGLKTENGIVVDEHLRSSDPDVFAAGDVANARHPLLDRHVRVEHWDNAIEQGRAVAHSMLGHDMAYDRMPYFFTDQYDLGMEYVGYVGPEGYDEVVLRGDVDQRVFTAFWLRDGKVQAAMHVNDWDAIDPVRAIVGTTPELSRLRDETVLLEEIATPAD